MPIFCAIASQKYFKPLHHTNTFSISVYTLECWRCFYSFRKRIKNLSEVELLVGGTLFDHRVSTQLSPKLSVPICEDALLTLSLLSHPFSHNIFRNGFMGASNLTPKKPRTRSLKLTNSIDHIVKILIHIGANLQHQNHRRTFQVLVIRESKSENRKSPSNLSKKCPKEHNNMRPNSETPLKQQPETRQKHAER